MAPRQPPSPVAEEADEGFSPCNSTMDNGNDVRINLTGSFVHDSSISLFTTYGTSSSVLFGHLIILLFSVACGFMRLLSWAFLDIIK